MAGQRIKSARNIAMAVLNQLDLKHGYAGQLLNKLLPQTNEKQRATDLVFGTLRNRAAIDTVIAKLADCPTDRIPDKLLNIIRIGAYELIYSPQTAEYSIVNEAVENAKAVAGKKQTGFVNALLRQITRHITNRQIPLSQANAQRLLPQTPLTGCEFDTAFLPEPEISPDDYLSTTFSLPKWLVSGWLAEFGVESARQICFASIRKPSIYIRPNSLKITTSQLAEKFRQAEFDLEIPTDQSVIKLASTLRSPRAITELPGFAEGLFSVQDITAAQPVRLLEPQPEWTILDLCAAPGTKTTQLAELTGDKAKIIATDIDSQRLEKVKENAARLRLKSISVIAYENLQKVSTEAGPFDCILLDVPCSNTGVLAKRPEVRLRITPKAISKLTKTQSRLLETATAMIKPEGKICYSTCSIQKAENSELIKEFLQKNRNFKLESELLTLPSAESRTNCPSPKDYSQRNQYPRYLDSIGAGDHDGGYVAIITRK
jgi:16S rRNA (cytosine967-C5)-methyltransferase